MLYKEILVGTIIVTAKVFSKNPGKIISEHSKITGWEAHKCTASPGTIAFPDQDGFIVESWVQDAIDM